MIIKKKFLVVAITLLILTVPTVAKAAPSNNPIFATIEQVEQTITDAISPIQDALNSLTGMALFPPYPCQT